MTLPLFRDLGKTAGFALAIAGFAAPLSAATSSTPLLGVTPLAGTSTSAVLGADDFQEGVALLRQGKKAEALQAFQRALASDPSNNDAYELWKNTDEELFLDMLVEGGEFELIARRFLDRARMGRMERRNDSAAIGALVATLKDAATSSERRAAMSALSAEHGEYAVPRLVRVLADSTDGDWRIIAMHTLSQMGSDTVLPLVAALGTDNAYQRANVAMVLGHVGDPRAAGALTRIAATDEDGKVRRAAADSAGKCGAEGSAADQFISLGEDYYNRRKNVLRDFDYSDVTWAWEDGDLASSSLPREVYHSTLAKRAYMDALAEEGGNVVALAGVARSAMDISARLSALAEAGQDVSDHQAAAEGGAIIAASCGVAAVDKALAWSVNVNDATAGVGLARVLGAIAGEPTGGLLAAMGSSDGALRGEAAVAIGTIGVRRKIGGTSELVAALGDAAGRDIMRLVAVIDGDAERAQALASSIGGPGVLVNHRDTGAGGINLLRRVGGFDAIVVGDRFTDMTVDQIISAASLGDSETPILLMTSDSDLGDAYADRVSAVIGDMSDLSELESIFEGTLEGDRARADDLSRRAAAVLGDLALAGRTELGAALEGLAKSIGHRPDGVAVPAMRALAAAGTGAQAGALMAVITDEARSDDARVAAGQALVGILGRSGGGADCAAGLDAVVRSDATLAVRTAAAQALGLAGVSAGDRAGLLGDI